ncbi:MAG: hypothetical protein IJ809_06500 [Clostridia bacterium]|nr:hypothetical protein [Clostridia bacterium]
MKIILPRVVTRKDIHTAAAYFIASNSKDVEDVVAMPLEDDESSNINCEEVKFTLQNSFNTVFHNLLELYELTKICDPLIEDAKSPIEAIEKVAKALRSDYEVCLKHVAVA